LADDRLFAGVIVDGIHLGKSFLNVALRAKGLDLAVLVTDAAMPAGCEPGNYKLGEVEVELLPPGDRVVLRGGTRLAGSALHMHKGVENLMKLGGLNLAQSVKLGTTNPARCCNVDGRKQGLVVGERADFVQFRFNQETLQIDVLGTWVNGKQVYAAN